MIKAVFFAVVAVAVSVLAHAEASFPFRENGAVQARKLMTDIQFGPDCTNSYFKSDPGFKKTAGKEYKPCCDTKKGFICATYTGESKWSTYASCMTKEACKASNGGKTKKHPGWNCESDHGFPQCQDYYALP